MKSYGYALPATVLILAAISVITSHFNEIRIYILRMISEASLAEQADLASRNMLLEEAVNFIPDSSSKLLYKCFSNKFMQNRVSISKSFCASFNQSASKLIDSPVVNLTLAKNAANLPALNFYKIMEDANDCLLLGGNTATAANITLSPLSAVSGQHCRFSQNNINEKKSFASNLEITSSLRLAAANLSARGFLHSAFPIELACSKCTIAAAGDIDIQLIMSEQASELTLISASGDVRVNSVKGPIRIRAFARRNTVIPADTNLMPAGFRDLVLDMLPLGFS